jgi:hypothetical protein
MNTPLPLTTVNRRAFIKTSILTAAAVGVLSQGKALAQTGSGFIPTPKIEYRLKCVEDPISIMGKSIDGKQPSGTPRLDGAKTWITSVVHDIGTYPEKYDSSNKLGRSCVYMKIKGKGPAKGDVGESFIFVGNVQGQHSIRADDFYDEEYDLKNDGWETEQQYLGIIPGETVVRKFIPEKDSNDINGESTVNMGSQTASLVIVNAEPKIRWTPNPTQIMKAKIAPIKRTDAFSGPVYISAAHDLAIIRGSVSVLTSTISETITTAASMNAKMTYSTETSPVAGEVSGGITRTVSSTLVAPTASTAVTDLLQWSITIEKRVDNGPWVDVGTNWEKAPTWQDKSV